MEHIFTPFHSSKPEGAGIGLTICREIIKRYGGDIQIQSEERKGTSVMVSFPRQYHG
jgi:signal transduction histidine kinase